MITTLRRYWRLAALAVLAGVAACAYISFRPPETVQETSLKAEIYSYYDSVKRAYALGNPDALVSLASPDLAKPMSRDQFKAWAEEFFKKNPSARFVVDKLSIEDFGFTKAIVLISFRVQTPSMAGDFARTEREFLVKSRGQWYLSGWEPAQAR